MCPGEGRAVGEAKQATHRWSLSARFISVQLLHSQHESFYTHQFFVDGVPYTHVLSLGQVSATLPSASASGVVRYRFSPRLSAGMHFDPQAKHFGPVANWVALAEHSNRPALVLGTSSDRIGLPHGQAFYATVSKTLFRDAGVPLVPYAGVAYGSYDGRMRPIGGLNLFLTHRLSSLVIFDGVNAHPQLNFAHRNQTISLLMVRGRHPGVSYSISF